MPKWEKLSDGAGGSCFDDIENCSLARNDERIQSQVGCALRHSASKIVVHCEHTREELDWEVCWIVAYVLFPGTKAVLGVNSFITLTLNGVCAITIDP